jgi:two-component system, cell cycle response regulator CpdR
MCEMHLSNSRHAAEQAMVLLVEDEDLLRDMLEETLRDAGFGVLSAASGEEATDLLRTAPVARALVTDINLGRAKMDGWGARPLAREHDPGCGIVYVSGDSAHRWAAKGVPRSLMLSKPFAPTQLVEAISNLLIDQAGSWRGAAHLAPACKGEILLQEERPRSTGVRKLQEERLPLCTPEEMQ